MDKSNVQWSYMSYDLQERAKSLVKKWKMQKSKIHRFTPEQALMSCQHNTAAGTGTSDQVVTNSFINA